MASNAKPHYEGTSLSPKSMSDKGVEEIAAKYLNIVWGGDSRYWRIPENEKSPVELYQVCWLEVTGCIDKICPNKKYEVTFHLSLKPDAFGWAGSPIYLMVKRGKEGKFAWKKITLDTKEGESSFSIVSEKVPNEAPVMNDEKKAKESDDVGKLYFGLYEVWSGKWKGGLQIWKVVVKETT